MKSLTVNGALEVLLEAKEKLGGNATLVLSLTNSSLQDVNVNAMKLMQDHDGGYVEVQVLHDDLQEENESWHRRESEQEQGYCIVTGNLTTLSIEVNNKLKLGWKVAGGLCYSDGSLYQVMVKG